jgi:hypothetical protein
LGYIIRSHELLDRIAKLRGLDASNLHSSPPRPAL